MAKKQGSGNPIPLLLLLGVALLLFLVGAAALLVPAVILIIALKCLVSYRKEKNATCARTGCLVRPSAATPHDLWLTEEEKPRFIESHNRLAKAIRTLNSAEQEANQKGLARNKDGRISRRSKLGKQLRARIENAEQKMGELRASFAHWQGLPQSRYKRLVSGYRAAVALGLGIVGFSVATYVGLSERFDDLSAGFRDLLRLPVNLADNVFRGFFSSGEQTVEYADVSTAFSVLGSAYATMFIVVFLAWIVAMMMTRKASRPPLVDGDTLDQFDVAHRYRLEAEAGHTADAQQQGGPAVRDRPDTASSDASGTPGEARSKRAEPSTAQHQSQSAEIAASNPNAKSAASGADEEPGDIDSAHSTGTPAPEVPTRPWSRLAIWSGFCGVLSIFFLPAFPAVILGHWALSKDLGKKKGLLLARIGVGLGWLFIALFAVAFFFGEA